MGLSTLRSACAVFVLLLGAAVEPVAVAAEGQEPQLTVADALTFVLPPAGAKGEALSFLVFNPSEDISNLAGAVDEIKGPNGSPLPSQEGLTVEIQKRDVLGERSFVVRLSLLDGAFAAPGDYQATLRLAGFDARKPPPDAGVDAGVAAPKPRATLFKSVTIRRAATQLTDVSAMTIRLERPAPFFSASRQLSYALQPRDGLSLPQCKASCENVFEKGAAEATHGALAPGKIAAVDADCTSGTVNLKLDGFDAAGEFTSALVVAAPGLGKDPLRLPLKIEVTDAIGGPLVAILLGVAIASLFNLGSQGGRARQELQVRLTALRAEVARRRGITEDPQTRTKLAEIDERLKQAAASSDLKSHLDATEKELDALADQLAHRRAETTDGISALDRKLAAVDGSALAVDAPRALAAARAELGHATQRLAAGDVTSAEQSLKKGELALLEASPDKRRGARPPEDDDRLEPELASAHPTIEILDDSREAGSELSFKVRPEPPLPGGPFTFVWEFDGTKLTPTPNPLAQHTFRDAGAYPVKVSIRDAKGVECTKLEIACRVRPSRLARAASTEKFKLFALNAGLFLIAALVATLTALTALYFTGKPFGTWKDYIGAFVWGFGTDASLRGLAAIVGALQKGARQDVA